MSSIPTKFYECVRCHDTDVVIPGAWGLTGVLCADCALKAANDSGDGSRAAATDDRPQPRQDKVTAAAVTAGADCDRALPLSVDRSL